MRPINLIIAQREPLFYAESSSTLPPGGNQVRMEFAYAGGGFGKGGTVSLYVDGKKVGEGKVGATEPMIFSGDDGCDVGVDRPAAPSGPPAAQSVYCRAMAMRIASSGEMR